VTRDKLIDKINISQLADWSRDIVEALTALPGCGCSGDESRHIQRKLKGFFAEHLGNEAECQETVVVMSSIIQFTLLGYVPSPITQPFFYLIWY